MKSTFHDLRINQLGSTSALACLGLAERVFGKDSPQFQAVRDFTKEKRAGYVATVRRFVIGFIVYDNRGLDVAQILALAVHVATDLTPEQVKAYRLADNKTGEIADWDLEMLPIELAELKETEFDMGVLGFAEKELTQLLNISTGISQGLTDPDSVPEPPDDPVTQKGDIWILGNHRLMCGDSAKPEDVDRLLDRNTVHLVNCDPPYNVRVESRSNNAIAAGLSSYTKRGATLAASP